MDIKMDQGRENQGKWRLHSVEVVGIPIRFVNIIPEFTMVSYSRQLAAHGFWNSKWCAASTAAGSKCARKIYIQIDVFIMFWSCHLRCHCMHTRFHSENLPYILTRADFSQSAEVSLPHLPDYAGQTRSRFWRWWKEMNFNLIDKCQLTSHGLGLSRFVVQMEPWTSFISEATNFHPAGNLWSLGYILDYIGVIMGGMWPTWTELQELIQCSLWMQTGFGPQTDQSMLQWPAPPPWRCPTLRKRRTELRCFAMQPGELLHHGLKIYISHVILILIFEDPLKSRKMKMDPDIASFPDTICASKEATKNMVDRTAFCVSLHKPQDIGIAADSGDSPCFSRLQLPLALILCNGDLHCNPCSLRSLYHHLGHQCSSTGMRNKIKPCQAAGGLLPYPTCSTCCFFFSRLGQQRQVHQIHCPCGETMGNGIKNQGFSGFWVSADAASPNSPIAWPCHAQCPGRRTTRAMRRCPSDMMIFLASPSESGSLAIVQDKMCWIFQRRGRVMVYLFNFIYAFFVFSLAKKIQLLHHVASCCIIVDTSFTAETKREDHHGHHGLRSSKLTSSTKTSKTQKARPGVTWDEPSSARESELKNLHTVLCTKEYNVKYHRCHQYP